MKKIVKTSGSVYVGKGAWNELDRNIMDIKPSKIFILTDNQTNRYCLPIFLKNISFVQEPEILLFNEGEKNKTIETCVELWNQLSEKGADRKSLLINLGGGVVTDLGGFVASTFKRGIEFINVPTSLLAMVDASVGGKNGVDLGSLKNQVGVIKNPMCVIVDIEFLKTLPATEVKSGLAEMIKHGLITSEDYWERVKNFDTKDTENIEKLIWESIEIKNKVVTQDPLENGLRKTLNFGHTLGHAIESYCMGNKNREPLLHGEAIAIGMILALYISSELLAFPKKKLDKITLDLLSIYGKHDFNADDISKITKLLVYDKKNSHGNIYFVLLKDFGNYVLDCIVPNTLIEKAFGYYKKS